MYRHIPQDKLNEVLEKESKYWSKVARKAIDNGKLSFWAVFVKVGGFDLPNSHNVLYVNTFKDINDQDGIWDLAEELFPDTKPEDYNTWGAEYGRGVEHMMFVQTGGWQQSASTSSEDFKFLKMVYHNTNSPIDFVNVEKEHWGPFIKKQMDAGNTRQVAWGNSLVLSPRGPKVPFNSISYDLYKSLGDALMPGTLVLPDGFWAPFEEIEALPRMEMIYSIYAVEGEE